MKVLIFGNPLVKEDSLPLKILPKLRKKFPSIEFKEFDTAESLEKEGEELIIIDTVKNIEDVKIFEDIEIFERKKIFSTHDYDLAYELKALKKLGYIKKVRIIGIPSKISEEECLRKVSEKLKSILFSRNDSHN